MAQEQNTETAAAKTYPPLEMEASVRLIDPKNNLLGFANVTFNGAVTVTDFKVLQDKDTGELYVGMPSKQVSGGKFTATTWIKGDEGKQQLTDAVITGFFAEAEKQQARAAAIAATKPPRIAEQMEKAGKEAAAHNAALTPKDKGGQKRGERT
jgi:DNA-binding cell septation regulator SpoVG